MYTNADQVRVKMEELRLRAANAKPHIIGITEVKPKNANFDITPSEIQIKGYKLYTNSLITGDGNRGCALHVKEDIEAQQLYFDDSGVTDSVWIEVKLVGNDKILIGCMYRSPNASTVYSNAVNKILVKVTQLNYSHVLIMGDFNHREIDWTTWTTTIKNENDPANLFIEAVRDSFMFQHVDQLTRIRGNQEPSLIDLILTN